MPDIFHSPPDPRRLAPDAARSAADKWVVVIGGGAAAMGCVRRAVRQGAAGVTWLCSHGEAGAEDIVAGWRRRLESHSDATVEIVMARPEGFGRRGAVRTVQARRPARGAAFDVAADLVIDLSGLPAQDRRTAAGDCLCTRPRRGRAAPPARPDTPGDAGTGDRICG